MAIVRYNPSNVNRSVAWPNLWDELDRWTGVSVMNDSMLAVDVYETDHDVVVKMPVPGIKADDLNISVTGDTVTVQGESRSEDENKDEKRNYYFREVRYGSFARSVTLPAPVQSDKAEASTEDGILTLMLPKAEEAKPKSIKVTTRSKNK
jgi:HSP20 family protein